MDLVSNINLTLYENLLSIDNNIKDIFNVDLKNNITKYFKREIIDFFQQKLKLENLDSNKDNVIDIIKNLYFEVMNIYSKNFLNNLEFIRDVKFNDKELNVINNFDKILSNIINDNLQYVEKILDQKEFNNIEEFDR